MKKVTEVGRGSIVESFIGEEKIFVVDTVLYREPVKLNENKGDVVQCLVQVMIRAAKF